MKIRSERGIFEVYCGFALLLVVLFYYLTANMCRMNYFVSAGFIGLGGLISICMIVLTIISLSRTLEMTEEGCKISFLCFEKFYKWEDFVVKRVEDYRMCKIADHVYNEGIFFSLHPWKKPKWISGGHYMIRHPWSCFAIHYKPGKRVCVRGHVETYEVDQDLFVENMQKWGVVIEGLTDKTKSPLPQGRNTI